VAKTISVPISLVFILGGQTGTAWLVTARSIGPSPL
jgi:hypothetical protein